jgi:hypothetical protein
MIMSNPKPPLTIVDSKLPNGPCQPPHLHMLVRDSYLPEFHGQPLVFILKGLRVDMHQ